MGLRRAVVWLGLAEHEDEVVGYDGAYPAGDDLAGYGELPGAGDLPGDDPEPAGQSASHLQIATVRPQNFRDALLIGQHYRQDIPVIVNLEDLEMPDAKRIVDFMSGLVFGRRGDIERLSARVFLIVPGHCAILSGQQALADKQFYNQT